MQLCFITVCYYNSLFSHFELLILIINFSPSLSLYIYVGNIVGLYIPYMMLNVKWMGFDARLMEQQVTRLFILFHTDTSFIDRPIDSVASPVETLLPLFDSHLLFVCPSFVCRSFVVCSSFVCLSLVPYLSPFIY